MGDGRTLGYLSAGCPPRDVGWQRRAFRADSSPSAPSPIHNVRVELASLLLELLPLGVAHRPLY